MQGYTKEVETKTLAQRVFKINTRYTTDGKENTESLPFEFHASSIYIQLNYDSIGLKIK
jgi:hypothetical protein